MQKFLHDHIDLQVSAMYALQVHCNAKGFPKGTYTHLSSVTDGLSEGRCLCRSLIFALLFSGMLLRYFVNFYDMEIIEEEGFLSWKEDVNQEYPGKGKALFQVILYPLLEIIFGLVKFFCYLTEQQQHVCDQ